MPRVFVALGANLADPIGQLERAVEALHRLPDTHLVACSRFYRSAPMGPADQPDYVNGVAELASHLAPHDLLDALQAIELSQGRERKAERWGPRTLDLDILLYGQWVLDDARLTLPHYGMKQRAFVLVPLSELAADLVLPDGSALADWVATCDRRDLHALSLPLHCSR